MKVLNYIQFKNNLATCLDGVADNSEVIVVSRGKSKKLVIISLEEYNAFKETIYLTSTKANRKRLDDAVDEMEKGEDFIMKLHRDI